MFNAIVQSGRILGGREWDAHDWYEILFSAYLREKGMETGTTVVGIMEEFLVLDRITAKDLDKTQFSEFMDSVQAYIDTNGIPWDQKPVPMDGYEGLADR